MVFLLYCDSGDPKMKPPSVCCAATSPAGGRGGKVPRPLTPALSPKWRGSKTTALPDAQTSVPDRRVVVFAFAGRRKDAKELVALEAFFIGKEHIVVVGCCAVVVGDGERPVGAGCAGCFVVCVEVAGEFDMVVVECDVARPCFL